MKKLKKFKLPVVAIIIIILFPLLASAQEDDSLIIPVYSGSDIRYDDQIGFEEFSFIINVNYSLLSDHMLTNISYIIMIM